MPCLIKKYTATVRMADCSRKLVLVDMDIVVVMVMYEYIKIKSYLLHIVF